MRIFSLNCRLSLQGLRQRYDQENSLLKALEKSGAPETCATGHALYVAILLKMLSLDIVAERKAAVKAKGEIVMENVLPEGAVVLIIPYLDDIVLAQIAEYPRLDMLLPAACIAPVAVPEEIAGMNVPLP